MTEPKEIVPRRYQRMCSIKDAQLQLNLSSRRNFSVESHSTMRFSIGNLKIEPQTFDEFAKPVEETARVQTKSSGSLCQKLSQVEPNPDEAKPFITNKESLTTNLKIFSALDEIKSELTETKLMLKIIKEQTNGKHIGNMWEH